MNLPSLLIGILLILGVGYVVVSQKSATEEPVTQTPSAVDPAPSNTGGTEGIAPGEPNPSAPAPAKPSSGITLAEVSAHSSRTSCWSAINGNVYDLTSWIPKHPGGEQAILGICGIDGSSKFNGVHGGAARQAAILAGFKIGVLAN